MKDPFTCLYRFVICSFAIINLLNFLAIMAWNVFFFIIRINTYNFNKKSRFLIKKIFDECEREKHGTDRSDREELQQINLVFI